MARSPKPRRSTAHFDDLPVRERTLDNGLRALVLPLRRAPIVVCDLYYPVGSFDEPPGRTGLAHFVEHMLFKGTERFPKGQIDRLVLLAGGQSNAETSEDSTHYWFAFPKERWELGLTLEADRMRGARFDPIEVEIERRVILEERARELNTPHARLDHAHLAFTYLRHPYRNPILGWPEDIARTTADDLQAFYQSHYRPDGAVLVVVGALDPEMALDRISRHFADVRASDLPRPRPSFTEPNQAGRRSFVLAESETAARGVFGWHTVSRGHPDAAILDVLADLLCGGRRSRLWQSLVETEKAATWIESAHATAHRGGQFFIQLESAPGADSAVVEERIMTELLRLRDDGPKAAELMRSRRRINAGWRWEQEDLTSLAGALASTALWHDWRLWLDEIRASLNVDAREIQRVVDTYLVDSSLTVGWSLPSRVASPGGGNGHVPEPVVSPLVSAVIYPPIVDSILTAKAAAPLIDGHAVKPIPWPAPAGISRLVDYNPRRVVLDNGLRLLYERRPGPGVIALELFVDAGLLREAKPGLACLTGRLLEEGTSSRTADELAGAIENTGGTLESGATGSSVRVCNEDLALGIELLADATMHPVFPSESVSWVARRIAAELSGDLEDPAFRAELSFRNMVYGDHPLARDPRGGVREITRLDRDDAVQHHRRHFLPEHSVLVAVGDFDPRLLVRLVKSQFGGWPTRGRRPLAYPSAGKPGRPRIRRIQCPGDQVHIVMGHLGVARAHPDFDALLILDHIFGSGPGFCDRLGRIVRDEMGLVYSIGGGMTDSADVVPGLFRVYAGTMPDQAERVIAAITEQIEAMHSGAFSDEEVDRARRYLTGAWVFDYQSLEQRAERLLELERWGLPIETPLQWPDQLAAVTARQVRKAARTHLRPESLCRVELGPLRRRAKGVRADCA
jgi:zinc protease